MNWRVLVVGLVGGVLLTIVLNYPLYQYLPGRWVEGWPPAQAELAQIYVGAAILLLVVYGAFAARMSATSSRLQAAGAGAVAGLIAALIAEVLVGGAAAGVWGSRAILAHGLHATPDQAEFLRLLTDAVVATQLWTFASVWIAFMAGLGLGALGGVIGGPGNLIDKPLPWVLPSVLLAGLLCAALSTVVAVAIFPLLNAQTLSTAEEIGRPLVYPSAIVMNLAMATNFVLLFAYQLFGWWALRQIPAKTAPDHTLQKVMAWVYGLFPFGMAGIFLLGQREYIFVPVVLIGLIVSLAIGVLMIRWGWSLRAHPQPVAAAHLLDKRFFAQVAAWGGTIWTITMVIGIVPASLNLVLLIIPLLPVLSLHDESAAMAAAADLGEPLSALVERNYAMHQIPMPTSIPLGVVIALLIAGMVWLIHWFVQRRLDRQTAIGCKKVVLTGVKAVVIVVILSVVSCIILFLVVMLFL